MPDDKPTKPVRVTSQIARTDSINGARTKLPIEVRRHLRAQFRDELVWEEATPAALERARKLGPYVIVRRSPLKRRGRAEAQGAAVVESEPAAVAGQALRQEVQRRLGERKERKQ
jgi:hypothetical protein